MPSPPKISVVVPNYNGAKYLDQCLKSLVSQDYPNKEVIVVDGFSKDNSIQIILSYPDIKLIMAQPKGEADAINVGMGYAHGDIMAFIDSDDLFPSDTFKKVGEYFATHNSKWLIGLGQYVDTNGNETRQSVMKAKRFMLRHYNYNTFRLFDYAISPAVFWRKELYEEMGGFKTDEKLAFEYEWWLRVGKKYKPGFIDDYLGIWRMHGASVTSKGLNKSADDALRLQGIYTGSPFLRLLQYCSRSLVKLIYTKERRQ